MIGYHWLPARPITATYSAYGYDEWFKRTKLGRSYRLAPVMSDVLEVYSTGWIATFTGTFSYNGPTSNHAGKGNVPTGANFLYEDGHVEWAKFNGDAKLILPIAAKSPGNIFYGQPASLGKGPW